MKGDYKFMVNKSELTYLLKSAYHLCDLEGEIYRNKYLVYVDILYEFNKISQHEYNVLNDVSSVNDKDLLYRVAKRNNVCLTDLF